jgi:glycosyltransferase involved in cell wall biosynthesis
MQVPHGITIAIPNWNHEVLLPRAVLSGLKTLAALREQGIPGEVLVVDDCSRDGSATLLRQLEVLYHREGLRVLTLQENIGLAKVRNLAITKGRYRYIVFVDADNEILPTTFPTFLETIHKTGSAAVYGTLIVRPTAGDIGYAVLNNESIQDKIFDGNYVDALALFDRLQLRDVGGYESSCPTWEDYALFLHLITNGREVVFVPMVFGYYYLLPGSMIAQTATSSNATALPNKVRRMFNQVGVRSQLPMPSRMKRYHPAFGFF